MKIKDNFLLCFLSLLSFISISQIAKSSDTKPKGIFSGKYKVECRGREKGCNCYQKPSSKSQVVDKLFHMEPLESLSGKDKSSFVEGKTKLFELKKDITYTGLKTSNGKTCFYDSQKLRPIYWANTNCPDEREFEKLPFENVKSILKQGTIDAPMSKSYKVFPTFYYVADETFYGDSKTEPLYEARTKKIIAYVNKDYRVDLDIQGTGKLKDGRVLNVWALKGGVWDYVVLPKGSWGLGIIDHYLYPFRTVAIDFTYLCKQAGLSGCSNGHSANKRKLIGSLLYIEEIVGTVLPNGKVHDGYVCAHDVGGAIKADRIDLFVGNMGGGNPYLPECRSKNAYIDHGIESLVPYDWRLFNKDGRVRKYEYRTVAPHKALTISLVKGARCKNIW